MMHTNTVTLTKLTANEKEPTRHSQESGESSDDEEPLSVPGPNTMMADESIDEETGTGYLSIVSSYNVNISQNVGFSRFNRIKRKPTFNDLKNILYLRSSLEHMGATFSTPGELLTYGNPSSQGDFEHMLRLGPIYEQVWSVFFADVQSASPDVVGLMWPDLRTLKKMLVNEGVLFDAKHLRITYGDSTVKMRRLCDAYDEMREQWLAMTKLRLSVYGDNELNGLHADNSSGHDSGCVDDAVKTGADLGELGPDHSKGIAGHTHKARSSGVPQNIGWRFSDDLESVDDIKPVPRNIGWRFSDDIDNVPIPSSHKDASYEQAPVDDEDVIPENIVVDDEFVQSPSAAQIGGPIHLESPESFESQLLIATATELPPSRVGTPAPSLQSPSPPDNSQGNNLQVNSNMLVAHTKKASVKNGREPKETKTRSRVRHWFRQALYKLSAASRRSQGI